MASSRSSPLLSEREEHTVIFAADGDSDLLPKDPHLIPTPKNFLDRPEVKVSHFMLLAVRLIHPSPEAVPGSASLKL